MNPIFGFERSHREEKRFRMYGMEALLLVGSQHPMDFITEKNLPVLLTEARTIVKPLIEFRASTPHQQEALYRTCLTLDLSLATNTNMLLKACRLGRLIQEELQVPNRYQSYRIGPIVLRVGSTWAEALHRRVAQLQMRTRSGSSRQWNTHQLLKVGKRHPTLKEEVHQKIMGRFLHGHEPDIFEQLYRQRFPEDTLRGLVPINRNQPKSALKK